jgi:hypothetical protein
MAMRTITPFRAGTLTEAIARNLAEHLQSGELFKPATEAAPDETLPTDDAVTDAIGEFDGTFAGDVAILGIPQLAGALFAELAHELTSPALRAGSSPASA